MSALSAVHVIVRKGFLTVQRTLTYIFANADCILKIYLLSVKVGAAKPRQVLGTGGAGRTFYFVATRVFSAAALLVGEETKRNLRMWLLLLGTMLYQ